MSARTTGWTVERKRRAREAWKEREELRKARETFRPTLAEVHDCDACFAGVHDEHYTDNGVCRCRCCGKDMTDEGFPRLEVVK